jgi:RNA 2',3'-cyclic 3'-phosphodiesterase
MPRLFVAVDIPEEHKSGLETLCSGLPGARWVRERQFHVTLQFIGDTDGPTAVAAAEALNGVRSDPFELQLAGLGHFPPRGEPRVLWAGVQDSPELMDLHRQVEKVLKRAGIPPEERKYAPHVTLAKLSGTPLPRLLEYIREHPRLRGEWCTEPFPVIDFQLFQSTLSSAGAQHRVEASYPLFAARPERR